MCGPHWDSWSHGILIQNVRTGALRIFWLGDKDAAQPRDFASETDEAAAFEQYTDAAITRELGPSERHVSVGEYMFGDKDTSLPCPNCRSLLQWHSTGIS
jgi:hypothetical protein